ncbi:mandelate racemase/muconate lactonizing enzyme family protein [Mucilaginibacter auburnensis]|nr:mandelate racemase/muconate lactonizing enzyme family protein [Mucilaginibacter auburnensis]
MKRRSFLHKMAVAGAATVFMPYLDLMASPNVKKVKITNVKCVRTKIGFRPSLLVKIETDAGIVGIGECHHDENSMGAKDVVLNVIKPILVGQDPYELERLVFKMSTRSSYYGGNHGIPLHAITGVEFALWDILGKLADQPVYKILGGGAHRKSVRAYCTSRPRDLLSKDSCQEFAGKMKTWGFTAAKVDFIRDQNWERLDNRMMSYNEIDRNGRGFQNVRDAVGPDFDIAVHAHWELDFDSALRVAHAVAPMKPWWFEDPLPIAYNEQWVKLTERSPIPILTGENLYTRDDFRPFIVNGAVNKIEIDISSAGGLLEAKKIADMAETYYISVATHNVAGPVATVASAHCAATIREFAGHEAFMNQAINADGKSCNGDNAVLGYGVDLLKDGYLQFNDKPGLGITLDEKLVKEKYMVPGETWWD